MRFMPFQIILPHMMPSKVPLTLETPIQYVKGVGPKLAAIFKTRNIHTVGDFIHWFPRTWQDNRHVRRFADIVPGRAVVVLAEIVSKRAIPLRRRNSRFYEVTLTDGSDFIFCKFFKAPYKGWFNSLTVGKSVEVRGTAAFYRNRLEFHHPQIFPFEGEPPEVEERFLLPVYTETEGVSQTKIRKIMTFLLEALELLKEELEWLPLWLREEYQLVDRLTALREIHDPNLKFAEDYFTFKTPYQKRLIFDEFFELQIYLALKQKGWQLGKAPEIPLAPVVLEELESKLPFQMTGAQKKVLKQICSDMNSHRPMHRLLQGDVGSGKTLVALMAALTAAKAGFQTAFMVPTEILAEQHYTNGFRFLEPFGVKVEKLTGKMKAKDKRVVLAAIKSGFCDICIGTHALIQEGVEFHNLGLVIVDEQHRFGSHQRAVLKSKGRHPHFLVMTATPIPRTLSLALYGDLEVSLIDEMPPGRKPIVTRRTFYSRRPKVFDFLKEQVEKGRQGYVVYPLVEESEVLDLQNAMEQYEALQKGYPTIRWGLLTGRMSAMEKIDMMDQFRKNKIQVLVATTVIEVGVDVPNATMMIVENGERFGLSQLHQLRGRVGRGREESYCVIVLGKQFSAEARERAEIMEKTTDGFKIAEKDLEIRGPGEFLGSRQSGLPGFKMAHLIRDGEVLALAKRAAFDLISKDPDLKDDHHFSARKKFLELSKTVRPG